MSETVETATGPSQDPPNPEWSAVCGRIPQPRPSPPSPLAPDWHDEDVIYALEGSVRASQGAQHILRRHVAVLRHLQALHAPEAAPEGTICREDGKTWPCPTVATWQASLPGSAPAPHGH